MMKKMKMFLVFVLLVFSLVYVANGDYPLFESLHVTLLSQDPDPAEPSQYVTLRFKITNIGAENAEDVQFEILPEYPFSLYSGDALVNLGSLHGRQVDDKGYIQKYKLRIDKNAVEGDHEIKVRYKIKTGEWITLEPFTVHVRSYDAILSVISVETDPHPISPGKEFDLSIKLRNVADSPLEYIITKLDLLREDRTAATVTYTEFPFSPLGSSNEKTIKMLASGRETEVKFKLVTDPDAESNVYKIPVIINYKDNYGMNYSRDHIITIVIADKPDISVLIDSSTVHEAGKKGEVLIKFVNKGFSNIKFLNLKLKPNHKYELLSSDEVYVGNIDSDDYETAEFEVFVSPDATEYIYFPIHMEYKDDYNRDYSKDYNLKVKLYTKEEALKLGLQKKSNTAGILIVIVIVVAGVFGYRRYRKKKKKQE